MLAIKRAAFMFNPDTRAASVYMPAFETAAQSLKVALITAPVHSDAEIETAITALGREPGGDLVVAAGANLALAIPAAARNNVPAVYFVSTFARDGGLLSYGADLVDIFRRAGPIHERASRAAHIGCGPKQRTGGLLGI